MKKVVIPVVIILVLLLGFGGFIAYQTNQAVTHLTSEEQTRKNESEFLNQFDTDDKSLKKTYGYEQIKIKNSKEDYEFLVDSYGRDPAKDLFILIHGLGGTGRTMLPYAEIFLERGYDCMMYDQQNSGQHPVLKNNMGMGEKQDLIDLIHYVRETNPRQEIHIFAESYGAETLLLAYPDIKDEINMIILDSPMSDGNHFIDQGLSEAAKANNIPFDFLKSLGSMGSKILEGYSYSELNALDKIDVIDNPILIISNPDDQVTPHSQALAIEEKAVGKKMLLLSNSKHTEMYKDEKDRYLEGIDKFLKP